MGNRGNIVIEKDGDYFTAPLFMYSHWTGSSLGVVLASALKRGRNRWDDPSYLARIIFSEMIQGYVMEETGFGLSNVIGDGNGKLWCVNIAKQTVRLVLGNDPDATERQKWTFQDFVTEEVQEEEEEE